MDQFDINFLSMFDSSGDVMTDMSGTLTRLDSFCVYVGVKEIQGALNKEITDLCLYFLHVRGRVMDLNHLYDTNQTKFI